MKRYGSLYKEIYSIENIKLAHEKAKRGKLHYSEVKKIEKNPDKYFQQIHDILKNKTFKNSEYVIFKKMDSGKERKIFKLPYFPDRIIHHCIMNIMEPIWMKTFINDTYSSLKGRGIHKGVKRIKKALRDIGGTKYCLKLDIRKFYPSIDHYILKDIIRKRIKDIDLLWLLDEIIDSTDGVPIGNYLSQYFGNLYLAYFDHWMKEYNKCKYYFRYCDDIVILSNSKIYLHDLMTKMRHYLRKKLKLKIKDNWQIFPINSRGIDFLGYRFFHRYSLLRKSIAIRFRKKIRKIETKHVDNMLNSVMSYYGWLRFSNCHNLWASHINDKIYSIIGGYCVANNINNPLRR